MFIVVIAQENHIRCVECEDLTKVKNALPDGDDYSFLYNWDQTGYLDMVDDNGKVKLAIFKLEKFGDVERIGKRQVVSL